MEKYWPGETADLSFIKKGVVFTLRASLAYELIHRFGAIAGTVATDKALDDEITIRSFLQEPERLVNRCFEIADLFVKKAEELGEIKRPTFDCEQYVEIVKTIIEKNEEAKNVLKQEDNIG